MTLRTTLSLVLLLAAAAARGDDPSPRWAYEGGYSVGASDGFSLAGGVRASARFQRLAAVLELQTLMSPSEAVAVEGDVSRYQFLMLGGAGYHAPLRSRWNAFALAVAGAHSYASMGERTDDSNVLPTAGVRLGIERVFGRRVVFGVFGVSAIAVADLGRAHDVVLGRDVGGVTALLSVSGGIGFGRN